MSSTNVKFLVVNITKIEAIVEELPSIGSRREMKANVDEILLLTKLARQQAYGLADSESKRLTRRTSMFCGAASQRKMERKRLLSHPD